MKWNRFTVKTKTEAEDIVISTLAEVGIEGVEIQDKQPLTEEDKAQMFVDIMPEGPADDGVAYLNFYLEEDADKDAILKDVREALDDLRNFMDIGEATIEESQTEDKDWINNWKQYFHQFYVDDILIVPSWEEGLAFTGFALLVFSFLLASPSALFMLLTLDLLSGSLRDAGVNAFFQSSAWFAAMFLAGLLPPMLFFLGSLLPKKRLTTAKNVIE